MVEWRRGVLPARMQVFSLSLAAGLATVFGPALAQDAIDPEANKILLSMTDNLKAMQALSVDYDADQEIVTLAGQKIQYSASGSIALDRAKGFRVTRKGPFADAELVFDGKTMSLYGKGMNVYAQLKSPGPGIGEAVEELRSSTGLDAPGADLLAGDPYAALTDGVTGGSLVGEAFVGGIECDHLAFRTEMVDWQIWISKGDKPLPLKYVITTKWVTGAPQYSLRLTNWKSDGVDPAQFTFTPPADAKKVDQVYADVIGELSLKAGE
jgi:hypothetical protein